MDSRKLSLSFLFSTSALLLSLLQLAPWIFKLVNINNALSTTSPSPSPHVTTPHFCGHEYTIELMSFDPLVIYVNNFLDDLEINHLLKASENNWDHSHIYHKRGEKFVSEIDTTVRSSQSSMISPTDPVARCLVRRIKSLLGNLQHVDIEPLQLVRYDGGERFRMHYDTLIRYETSDDEHTARPYDRMLSTFVYLEDNCTGGETYFPELQGVGPDADGDKFSRTETGKGLLFKPRRGNAVIWNNLHMNGTGDWRLAHASLPVKSGTKIGMNIFSVYYTDLPIIGELDV